MVKLWPDCQKIATNTEVPFMRLHLASCPDSRRLPDRAARPRPKAPLGRASAGSRAGPDRAPGQRGAPCRRRSERLTAAPTSTDQAPPRSSAPRI